MSKIQADVPETVEDAPVVKLPDDAAWDDLQVGVSYLAHVGDIKGYGVFVNITPNQQYGVGGLVHNSDMDLFARSHEFTQGDPIIVTPVSRRSYDEVAYRLVDTLWNKDLVDVDLTKTYQVDGYPTLGEGDEVEPSDGSDDIGTLGARVDSIENLDSVGETISLADDPNPDPGKVPEPDTKLSLVLRAVGWVDGPATSPVLNDRLETTNSSRQLLDLWQRHLLDRHDHEDDPEIQYEYVLNEHGEEAAEVVAEQEERTADDYPPKPGDPAPDVAQERTEDAGGDDDTETMTETETADDGVEAQPDDQMTGEDDARRPPTPAERSLDRAFEVVEDSLRDGYDVEDVSLDMDHESVEVSVRLEVGDDV